MKQKSLRAVGASLSHEDFSELPRTPQNSPELPRTPEHLDIQNPRIPFYFGNYKAKNPRIPESQNTFLFCSS